jgi:hypothetical protein
VEFILTQPREEVNKKDEGSDEKIARDGGLEVVLLFELIGLR